ncbi:MAG: DUF2799 domain-containing protein [Duganella sp.]
MTTISRLLALLLVFPLLAGCTASFRQQVEACKVGDWNKIGMTDGLKGVPSDFAERKDFCGDHGSSSIPADAGARYSAGWEQGNAQKWSALGVADGARGLPPSQFAVHAASEEVRKLKTPLNQRAYDDGWNTGNTQYWDSNGKRDGVAGQPLNSKEAARSKAAAMQLRFDEAAYTSGWHVGNRQFWQDAGTNDASNGVPDSELLKRAATARSAGVQVQEEVYRAAWNAEIVNYWRNLGARDAVSGMEFGSRGREARQKGLKVFESEYRQAWEKRLAEYWRQAGLEDGFGKPFLLEERIANAKRDGVFSIPGTRAWYTRAWEEQNALYCQPDNAFERGRTNSGMAVEVCRPELRNPLKRAYLSGQDYEQAAARQRQAVNDAREIEARLYDANKRVDRIERDLRNNQPSKDKPATEEMNKQNRRSEQERREVINFIRSLERRLDDVRRAIDHNEMYMQRLRREIY